MDHDPASLLDIVLECRRLRGFVAGRQREDLDQDELLQYAVLHAIALLGEAATRLSPEFLQAHSGIPWSDIIGTRHRIIHVYDQVKLDVIWAIATEEVVLLLATTGQIRNASTDDIACGFIDTVCNGESFVVRDAYFTGADEPYEKLKRALKAEIDEEAWSSLYSTTSRLFPKPESGKIAVKVNNYYGDEVLNVIAV